MLAEGCGLANALRMFTFTSVPGTNKDHTRRPSIIDVARVAGVSHATVSRVLNESGRVRPETAVRVREAIAKTGYSPDPLMSALAAYRTRQGQTRGYANLAFLDRDGTPYSRQVLEGIREEAALHGYSVETHLLTRDEKKQLRLGRVLYSRGVRGLLFGPSHDEWVFPAWNWDAFAMVSLGGVIHQPVMHTVCLNYFDGIYSATCRLIEAGCRRIGFAVDPRMEARTGHRWLGGYAAAMGARQLHVFQGKLPARQEEFAQWCQRKRLDAVLTLHGELASVWPGRRERFILLNYVDAQADASIPHLFLDPRQIGAEGVRFLHQLLLRQEYGLPGQAKKTEIPGAWILPDSP